MIDPFGRHISYLRVSVTDRCDFRCVYCMAEDMTFLPKAEVLSLEELERLCGAFVRRGVKKLRLTGGEPLVRKNVMSLVRGLGKHLDSGALEELTLTTNGSQLAKYAKELAAVGVKRLNVSLDTLDPVKFRELTRWGDLDQVMRGLDAAQDAGLKIKINAVALRDVNDGEFETLIRWSHGRGMDLVFIEVMPMGEIGSEARLDQYLPLSMARTEIERHFTLAESDYHEKRARRMNANAFIMVDGSDSTTSFQALGAVEGLMARLNVDSDQPDAMPSIVLFNSQAKASYFLLPGLLSILVLDYVFLAAYALVKERQTGTMERLLMTPLQPAALLLGKLVPYGGLGFLNMALLLALMRWVFFVPIRGDVPLLLVASALYMLSILSISLFVASKAQTVGEIVTVTPLIFIIGVFVSGYVWPLASLPKLILPIAYLHPTTHMVSVLRGISIRNAPLSELLPHFAYFVVTSAVLLTLAVRRFRAAIQV